VKVADPVLKDVMAEGDPPGSALLASHRIPLPATFAFDCYGTRFDVGIRRSPDGGAVMVLRGNLGILPYSAESKAARNHLHAVLDAGRSLPNAEISLDSRQTIVIRGSMTFSTIPSPATVAAGTAAITIAVRPVCELIAACRLLS
jgi:hypothetical protein